jgi:hypothetical protein
MIFRGCGAERVEGWKDGRMEGWKDGRVEEWKNERSGRARGSLHVGSKTTR